MNATLHAICEKHFPDQGAPSPITRPSTGKFNQTRFFRLDGRDYVVRMAPPADAGFLFYEKHMMAQEPAVHALVQAETNVPVAPVVVYDDTCSAAPRPFVILERLPGVPLCEACGVDVHAVFREVGGHLAELHRNIRSKTYGYCGAHHPMEPAATWEDAFADMWHRLIEDIAGCGGYTGAEADRMRRLFERDRAAFARSVPAALLHMDIWHQNILVDRKGRVTGIVDWDRALWGDVEIEFAVLDYCGVSVPAFWDGYGAERDTSPEARLRGLYYTLYELQKYIVIRTLRGKDASAGRRYAEDSLRLAASIA